MVQESMLETLKTLKKILEEEKQILINNEGKEIEQIVSKKEANIKILEDAEIEDNNK